MTSYITYNLGMATQQTSNPNQKVASMTAKNSVPCNDATNAIHDTAAQLGYAVTFEAMRKYFDGRSEHTPRKIDARRAAARVASTNPAVPAKQSREIYSAAYDAGSRAAIEDLKQGHLTMWVK